MNNKIITILSIFFMITLSGCQQSDVSLIPNVPSEDVTTVYSETDTTTSSEDMSVDEPVDAIEVMYLPLIINSMLDTEITEIYISQSNLSSWGENITDEPLTNDISIELELPIIDANSLTWDFLLVDEKGNEVVIPEVDFSSVTLAGANIVFECNNAGEYFYFFL